MKKQLRQYKYSKCFAKWELQDDVNTNPSGWNVYIINYDLKFENIILSEILKKLINFHITK